MEKDLFLLILALIIRAVFQINLLQTIAVVDVVDRLICLVTYSYIAMRRRQKRKCPSRSAKRDGRLR